MTPANAPSIAIACGGTGGHLFPGLAVAEQLSAHGCSVVLFVSPKEVDQLAAKTAVGLDIVTLPAVGLARGTRLAFFTGFYRSWRAARRCFKSRPPAAALAMGGFTAAPPILAAKQSGAWTAFHESNTIPGRANRWLSRLVNQAFVGFPQAAGRLKHPNVVCTGTPVRRKFQPIDPCACRVALGLDPGRPVLLVMGGSQGARGINRALVEALPALAKLHPALQLLHLAGPSDVDAIKAVARACSVTAAVHAFLPEMDLALGAATVAVSRAGASSLAELAAMRLPSVLVPYPEATDNHQFHNARAFEETGAARLIEQHRANPETLAATVVELFRDEASRQAMQTALARWHSPKAAETIAGELLRSADAALSARGATNRRAAPSHSTTERQEISLA